MDLWFVIAAPIVVAAFLVWYLLAQRRRRAPRPGSSDGAARDPQSTWDALSAGEDPTGEDR